jgi:hypothetical protein
MYKFIKNDYLNKPSQCVIRTTDGACIPMDEANTDYQAFLLWKSEGNEPLPANE